MVGKIVLYKLLRTKAHLQNLPMPEEECLCLKACKEQFFQLFFEFFQISSGWQFFLVKYCQGKWVGGAEILITF